MLWAQRPGLPGWGPWPSVPELSGAIGSQMAGQTRISISTGLHDPLWHLWKLLVGCVVGPRSGHEFPLSTRPRRCAVRWQRPQRGNLSGSRLQDRTAVVGFESGPWLLMIGDVGF